VLCVCIVSAWNKQSSNEEITREEIAHLLLKSNAYHIKDYSVALHFVDLLSLAFDNYTFTSEKVQAFPCQPTGRSTPKPVDATKLLPGDIDLVIAMGDSLTAGFGADATSLFNLFIDYRGTSFSIGGSKTVDQCSTIANILALYHPGIQGFSTGNGNQNSQNAKLNVAVTGATSYELNTQVSALVSKLQAGYDINGWKLLTFFIGGNDLCDACNDNTRYSAANFRANVEEALDLIKAQVTNVFINLSLPPDVSLLSELSGGLCGILHPFECSCNTDPSTSPLHKEYVSALIDLVNLPKYHDKLDFHVVIQPFLEDIQLPRLPDGSPDKSYFAPDCFHFSAKSHAAAGLALWNNMMETAENKKRQWVVGEPFECPAPGQFIQ